jgi:O-antigen/teichoic acid export membrane protein
MTRSASSGQRNLLTNAAANWLGFALQVVVAFFLSPILVQALGLQRYGVWSLVESILAYLVLLDFGVGASVVRFVAKFEATHDYDKVNRVFSTSICIFSLAGCCAIGLATGLAVGVLPFYVGDELIGEARWLLVLLGINLGIGLPLKVFPCLLDGLGRYPVQAAVRAVGLMVRSALLFTVAVTGGSLVPLALVITACNLAEYGVLGFVAWHYMPELKFSLGLVDRSTLTTMRGYTVDAFVAMIAGRLSFQTDAIVIGAFLMEEQIAFFAIGARLVEYAKDSFRAITLGLVPAVSVLEAHGDTSAIRRVLLDGTRYVFWLVLPVQMGLMILGQSFLALWMKNDPRIAERSYYTLLILATPLALALPQAVAARILYGTGQLRWFARATLIEAVANLLLSVALVIPMGIEGVAVGTAIPNLIGNVALIFYICRTLEVGVGTYVRHAFLAPFMLALALACGWLIVARGGLTSWTSLIGTGLGGLIGYLLVGSLIEFGPRKVWEFLKSVTGRLSGGRRVRAPSPEVAAPRMRGETGSGEYEEGTEPVKTGSVADV